MRSYPLIRNKLSNEYIMAGLFIVILLYILKGWLERPSDMLSFIAVLILALILDQAAGFVRYKRITCSVSAAVTAAVLHVITPDIPLWGKLIGICTAIVIGKQIWGGTGKNTLNPAILGYLVIRIIYKGVPNLIESNDLIVPALILSLPFALYRPFVSTGYLAGILFSVLTGGSVFNEQLVAVSIFASCILLTDPVSVTPLRIPGMAGGFLCAIIPLHTTDPVIALPLMILIFNLLSFLIDEYICNPRRKIVLAPVRLKSPYSEVGDRPVADISLSHASETDKMNTVGLDTISEKKPDNSCVDNLDSNLIIEKIKTSLVYGMGGAAFPTDKKLRTVLDSNVEDKYFIINGAECDPGLIHDKWLLQNRIDDVLNGIRIIMKCIRFSKVILAVKGGYVDSLPEGINIHAVKNYYPVGYENNLIKEILGKSVPSDFVPAKLGILVLNVQTVLSVYEAVCFDKKADKKYITIADLHSGNAMAARVRTGDSVIDSIKKIYPDIRLVFTGGGIMQARVADDEDRIGSGTNLIASADMPRYKESPFCSKCTLCVSKCPQGLLVNRIADLVDKGELNKTEKYSPNLCIGCGLCSYVCMAGRNLSARVCEAKEAVTQFTSK